MSKIITTDQTNLVGFKNGLLTILFDQYINDNHTNEIKEAGNKQLFSWLDGKSKHLSEYLTVIHDDSDRCCPDFSCCYPELLWDLDTRLLFITDIDSRERLLNSAVSNIIHKDIDDRIKNKNKVKKSKEKIITPDISKPLEINPILLGKK